MDDNRIYELLSKSFSKEATEQDLMQIEHWKKESTDNFNLYNHLKDVWEQTRLESSNNRSDLVFEKIIKKIENESNGYPTVRSDRNQHWVKLIIKWAAMFLIVISSAIVAYRLGKNNTEAPIVVGEVVKSNPIGQKSRVFLPDGSVVILNSQSSISYSDSFNDEVRLLKLTGEAFFIVKSDVNRPFIVQTTSITTTVLGTSFNVNAYPNQKSIVSIASGKVKVSLNNQDEDRYIVAEAGNCIKYQPETKDLTMVEINIEDLIAWKDGIIVFNDNTFIEIIEQLSNWYGVEFKIEGTPLETWRFTGRFNNEYLTNILESISYGRDFEYRVNDKIVTLKFKHK